MTSNKVAFFAALVAGACTIQWAKDDTTKNAAAKDSLTMPAVATARPDSVALDTLVGLAFGDSDVAVAAAAIPTRPPVPSNSKASNDTGAVTATPLELEQLRVALDVPVQGVARAQLRDNFSEARSGHAHEAIDILAPRGTPVLSATDGRVLKLFESKAGGHMVYAADATDRFILMYAHLDYYAPGLEEGMVLRRGQVIGYVGTSGNAPVETPHLHFAIARGHPSVKWWKGVPINPYPLLSAEPRSRGGD